MTANLSLRERVTNDSHRPDGRRTGLGRWSTQARRQRRTMLEVARLEERALLAASASLSQWANLGTGSWVNGNLNGAKASYLEDMAIPYRMVMTGISSGSHSLTIEWDTTKGGKHALDYITDYDEAWGATSTTPGGGTRAPALPQPEANPTVGVSNVSATTTFWAIPTDANVTAGQDQISGNADDITQLPGQFKLYGGTITGVSSYTVSGSYSGDSSTRITINFTMASAGNSVLAWGGHIARRPDWGAANSVVAISGSPFHTRLIALDGSGGSQDRALASDAAVFPSSITVVKSTVTNGNPFESSQAFNFTATNLSPTSFSLDTNSADNTLPNTQVFANITTFDTKTITETLPLPTGWSFTSITISGASSSSTSSSKATINLKEGEDVTITYKNTYTNQNPTAVNDTGHTDEDTVFSSSTDKLDIKAGATTVLANDTDPENQTLTVTKVNGSAVVAAGTQITTSKGALVVMKPDGTFTYDPNGKFESLAVGQSTTDTFTYDISDGNGGTAQATVTITINGVNDAPVAVDDAGHTDEDTVFSSSVDKLDVKAGASTVLANDTDVDTGDVLTVTKVNGSAVVPAGTQITTSKGALVVMKPDGTFTYDPNGKFESLAVGQSTTDTFTYDISDGNGGTAQATVTITINGKNDAPSNIVLNSGTIFENESFKLVGSFTDPDSGDTHTVTIDWGDGSPTTTINLVAGVFTFESTHQYKDDNPTATSQDTYTIKVTVEDNHSGSASKNTTVLVKNVAPVVTPVLSNATISIYLGIFFQDGTFTFTDQGTQDTHTAKLNWGEGPDVNLSVTEANGSGSLSGYSGHVYSTTGTFTVTITVTDDDGGVGTSSFTVTVVSPQEVTGGPVLVNPSTQVLTQRQLQPLVSAAIDQWRNAGVSAAGLDLLHRTPIQISDLSGGLVGGTYPGGILIDTNAAGHGWFVDRTPRKHSEFNGRPSSTVSGRVDLLTVLVHEMGNVLGFPETNGNDIMGTYLPVGVRRLAQSITTQPEATRPVVALNPGAGSSAALLGGTLVLTPSSQGMSDPSALFAPLRPKRRLALS